MKLGKAGIKEELVEDYADYYFRSYDVPDGSKKKVEKIRENEQVHKIIKRFMECCA